MNYDDYVKEVLVLAPWRDFDLPKHGRVLEIGSGWGWGLSTLRSMGLDAVGIDLDPKGVGIIRGDATRLPFGSDSFDGAVCFRTLPHIQDEMSVLHEIARTVRRGGFFLVAVGNRWSYTLLQLRTKLSKLSPNPWDRYYRLYTRKEIQFTFEASGFKVANFRNCHYLPRLMSERKGWTSRSPSELAHLDATLGLSPILGLFGPLHLVHGVKH